MKDYSKLREYLIEEEDTDQRIDLFLSLVDDDLSRSYIQKLIKEEMVFVNNKPIKSKYKTSKGDSIKLYLPKNEDLVVLPENIPLDIIYEDDDIIIVNKPKGMVVHPAPGHMSGTLVNALLFHSKDNLSTINGMVRPGIVHRIDRDTTGILVVCKNDVSHVNISEQFKVHSITRKYHAIVHGRVKEEEGSIIAHIGRHPIDRKRMSVNSKNGKNAITHYKVLEYLKGFTYVECTLETGRTHQIRVHMASLHHPILGDTVYGPSKTPFSLEGQTLHAKVLGIIHPTTGAYMEFEAPLPSYFSELLNKIRI